MTTQDTSSKRPATPTLALFTIVILVIVGLTIVDRLLAKAQDAEVRRLAQRSYLDGIGLRRTGKTVEAVEAFRKAHALDRRNTQYELELIDALIDAGKTDPAERLIRDVLEREPNDGRANLLGAHLMIKNGRTVDAESYYHRAIYGEWPSDAAAHRVAVRKELVDFLAARPDHEELLAELLPLQEQAGKNPATEKYLARLFLVAGSATRAADEYRSVIKQDPNDSEAHTGLGSALLQLGEYGRAHDAFRAASALKSDDAAIRQKLELSSTLAALDPTSRKLTSMEKYRRSVRILDLARSSLDRCLANRSALDTGETRQLLTSANEVLERKPRSGITNEIAEEALGLGERLWQARVKACGAATSPDEEPMRLIVERLAQ